MLSSAYRDMLATVQTGMARLINEGKNLDEVVSAQPTAVYDDKWGGGFLKPDPWVKIVFSAMRNQDHHLPIDKFKKKRLKSL